MIVDSSAALSWASTDEKAAASQALFARAAQEQVRVPGLWSFEVANKLVIGLRKGRLTVREYNEALAGFQLLDLRLHPPASLALLAESAQCFGLTAYDAAFFELALREGQPLATFDQKMRVAAVAADATVLP